MILKYSKILGQMLREFAHGADGKKKKQKDNSAAAMF